LKAVGGSTKSLHTHLQTKHKISVLKRAVAVDAENSEDDDSNGDHGSKGRSSSSSKHGAPSATSIDKYLSVGGRDNSMAATIARMTACDGLPFRLFSSSPDIRRLMASGGYSDLP
jgi:hypothetical protein